MVAAVGALLAALAALAATSVIGERNDKWLVVGVLVGAPVSVVVRAGTCAADRRTWLVLCGAITLLCAESTYYVVNPTAALTFPSLLDLMALGFYVCTPLVIVVLVRGGPSRAGPTIWLDGLLGGLMLAALGADFVLAAAIKGSAIDPAVLNGQLSYAVADLFVLGFASALWLLGIWRGQNSQRLFVAAFVLLAAGDSIYLHEVARGDAAANGAVTSLWAAGLVLLAAIPWTHTPDTRKAVREGTVQLLAPMMFTCVGVLIVAVHVLSSGGVDVSVVIALVLLPLATVRLAYALVDSRRGTRVLVASQAATAGALVRAREAEALVRTVTETIDEAFWVCNADASVAFYVSPMCGTLFDTTSAELYERPLRWLPAVHPDDRAIIATALAGVGQPGGVSAEFRLLGPNGAVRWLHARVLMVHDEGSDADRMVGSAYEITDAHDAHDALERSEDRYREQALHDPLTKLANRTLFLTRAGLMLAGGGGPQSISLAMVDLDGFKAVNDSLGHAVGDELLIAAAGRLSGSVRSDDLVARLGGDEFAVMMVGPGASGRGARIAEALSRPYTIDGRIVSATASVGTATASIGDVDADELLRRADVAMYEAKGRGGRGTLSYDADLEERSIARGMLARDFTRALSQNQLVVYYQPIVRLADGRIDSVEALVRWQHPDRGLLGPDSFLAIAHEAHSIVPLGRFVLREATVQVAAWNMARDPSHPINVQVNLSGPELLAPDLIATVQDALSDSGLDPGCLTLEVTESALVTDLALAALQMQRLVELGVRFSLDDFGSGYSSLGYLHNLQAFSNLKIDRALVSGEQPRDLAILEAIVTLAHNLDMDVIAEGIETPRQRDLVAALGCERGQGYLFGRPCDAAATATLLVDAVAPDGAAVVVAAPDCEVAPAEMPARPRILVVNDHLPTLQWIGTQLRQCGYQPYISLSAQDGDRIARREHPDLILIDFDLDLPHTAGRDLANAIRSHTDTADIPLIAYRPSRRAGALDDCFDGELGDLAGRSPAELAIEFAKFRRPEGPSSSTVAHAVR